jgi:hypothetical protein
MVLDYLIGGSISLVMVVVTVYWALTQLFGWGPSDT